MSRGKPQQAAHDHRRLDPLLTSRIRLAAMTLLSTTDKADFSFLKQQTGTSDGNLGSHMRKLVESGYIAEAKGFQKRRPRTVYSLTDKGRRALENYLAQLHRMLDASRGTS